MAIKKATKPAARVTLVEGLSYDIGKYRFRRNKPQTISGEAMIASLESNSRFAVRRLEDIQKETLATRKRIKPSKTVKKAASKPAPASTIDDDDDEDGDDGDDD